MKSKIIIFFSFFLLNSFVGLSFANICYYSTAAYVPENANTKDLCQRACDEYTRGYHVEENSIQKRGSGLVCHCCKN